jgi:hypothetical protein
MEMPGSPLPPIELIERKNNNVAVAAGVCGIGSIVLQLIGYGLAAAKLSGASLCSGLAGWAWFAGIVLGIIGLVQIRRHPEQKGKAWAMIGIGIGFLRICIIMIIVLLIPVVNIGAISTKISATLTPH